MLYGMLLIDKIKNMNKVINKFFLAGDKFMPEMHLRQPQFVYSACGPFTRHKERIKRTILLVIQNMIFIKDV